MRSTVHRTTSDNYFTIFILMVYVVGLRVLWHVLRVGRASGVSGVEVNKLAPWLGLARGQQHLLLHWWYRDYSTYYSLGRGPTASNVLPAPSLSLLFNDFNVDANILSKIHVYTVYCNKFLKCLLYFFKITTMTYFSVQEPHMSWPSGSRSQF